MRIISLTAVPQQLPGTGCPPAVATIASDLAGLDPKHSLYVPVPSNSTTRAFERSSFMRAFAFHTTTRIPRLFLFPLTLSHFRMLLAIAECVPDFSPVQNRSSGNRIDEPVVPTII